LTTGNTIRLTMDLTHDAFTSKIKNCAIAYAWVFQSE